MGRRDKERKAKVVSGEEPPRRNEKPEPRAMLQCKLCKVIFPEFKEKEHEKECTGRQPAPYSAFHLGDRLLGDEL